jgi:hypothetical protein
MANDSLSAPLRAPLPTPLSPIADIAAARLAMRIANRIDAHYSVPVQPPEMTDRDFAFQEIYLALRGRL